MLEQGKGVITIEKLTGGWGYDLTNNAGATALVSDNPKVYTSSTSGVALNRPHYEGQIAPGLVSTTVTDSNNLVNGLALNGDVDSAGTAYCLLGQVSGTCGIVWFDATQGTPSIGTNFHGIAGTANVITVNGTVTIGDIVNAYVLTGTPPAATPNEYIFYSYDYGAGAIGAGGNVGRRDKSAGTFNDTYLTGLTSTTGTALFASVPHPLAIGLLDKLLIGNGRYLAVHDPTTTTVDYQALDMKAGFTIVAVTRFQSYNAVLAYRGNRSISGVTKGQCILGLWDGFSQGLNFSYPLKDFTATSMYNDGTDLFFTTYGRNGTAKLWKFNGSGFDLLEESALIGSAPIVGGIDSFFNHITWQSQGVLWAFKDGLHLIGGSGSGTGMAKSFYSNAIYTGDVNNNAYSIKKADFSGYALNGVLKTQLYSLPTNSTITCIKVYLSQLGSGGSVVCSLFKDYNATSIGGGADLINTTIDNATYGAINYFPIQKTVDNVNSFYMTFFFNHLNTTDTAAIIRKVEVEYEYDLNNQ